MKIEMKETTNPFMITSNQNYGIVFEELKNCELNQKSDFNDDLATEGKGQGQTTTAAEPKLSFLYKRESDRIGSEVEVSKSALARAFDKGKPLRKRQLKFMNETVETEPNNSTTECSSRVNAILDDYKHERKTENPLFTTTSNDYGSKKPSKTTYTTMRYSRSQSFSKSFNRIMFQDQGLNTSLTRSNVHERLETHFV